MSDFYQDGTISTLHDFGTKSTKDLEKDLLNFSKETSLKNITDELNYLLEKMIIKKPEYWIWSHNRWK